MPKAAPKSHPSRNAGVQSRSRNKHKPQPKPDHSPAETLTDRDRIFVEHMLHYNCEIGPLLEMQKGVHSIFRPWTEKECKKLLAMPKIQAELTKRRERQELANAKSASRAGDLTPEFLKASLADAIEESTGIAKVTGITLGLTVTAVLAKNELLQRPELKAGPSVYRALQSTVVQRVTETITQTSETVAPLPEKPALPAADVEILDY
jgi:hypothetical protein